MGPAIALDIPNSSRYGVEKNAKIAKLAEAKKSEIMRKIKFLSRNNLKRQFLYSASFSETIDNFVFSVFVWGKKKQSNAFVIEIPAAKYKQLPVGTESIVEYIQKSGMDGNIQPSDPKPRIFPNSCPGFFRWWKQRELIRIIVGW